MRALENRFLRKIFFFNNQWINAHDTTLLDKGKTQQPG